MYLKKSKITILLLLTFILTSCSTKTKHVQTAVLDDFPIKLNSTMATIVKNCQAKDFKDEKNSIYIKHQKNFLAIDLNEKNEFRNHSYNLTQNTKNKLQCIIPILKENSKLFIVVTGHANENKDEQQNQHLSDNRAISVAEFLFNEGIRDEIFTKGCSNNLLKQQKEKLDLFIYADKSNIKNHCQ